MAIYYTGRTALDFWRWKASTLSTLERPKPVKRPSISDKPVCARDIVEGCSHFRSDGSPAFVLVKEARQRHEATNVRYVVCGRNLPPSSIFQLNRDRYVVSPELAFTSMANSLTLVQLTLLGCELAGTYVLRDLDERGFSACDPLASVATMRKMTDRVSPFPGVARARKALDLVVENAASPMEASVALLLTLPCRLGGYGLPRPQLNHKIALAASQAIAMHRRSITLDMAWLKARFAVEYESTAWHRGDLKFVQDSIRRNDIRSLGYDVTTITLDEYKNATKMDRIAANIATKVGHRLRLSRIDRDKQASLRRELWQANRTAP